MNLEDQIRASARAQSGRYHPTDDLLPRVEHRRRQRAARRLTASAVSAVVLFGGAALALNSLRDHGGDTNIANSTVVTVESTEATARTTTPSTTTPSTTQPTSLPVSTTAPAIAGTDAPEINVPQVTEPNDANVPSPTAYSDGSTGISEFWNVPSYGSEPVLGSGCGANGQIGDKIPDGIWAGYIVGDGSDGMVEVDLLCIYTGSAAQSVLAGATATTINADPNYLIVNNQTRARSMPMDANVVLRLAERDASGRCIDTRSTTQWADIPSNRQTWIRIHGGHITWIIADCPPAG